MIVLGLDPGFRRFGWCIVELDASNAALRDLGVWKTDKSDKKLNIRKASDNHRRGQLLGRELLAAIDSWKPDVITAEAISFVRSASVMAQIGRVWGLIDLVCVERDLPLLEVSPQDLKQAVCGRKDASKLDVQAAVDRRFAGRSAELLAGIRAKGDHEHPVDAVGSVIACLDADVIRLGRRSAGAAA